MAKGIVSRFFSALGMAFWVGLLTWFGWWLVAQAWYLMGHGWPLMGIALMVLALFLLLMCVRGVWLVLMLLAGYTTPNLARRDFRNTLANFLMVVKAGSWKE
ncbi:MAG: hypothetical protein DI585_01175 [Pseudomonas fluorescens]|nr:MAG: hypothetical protein DI585_01175 [Pseudomonas fluorescens]